MTGVISPDSTDVLSQDSDTGVWSIDTDNGDHVETTYDSLDRVTSVTDQRGVIRQHSYDSAGRLSADTVTDLGLSGQNVDGAVRRIGYAYDDLGRHQTITSYSDTSGTTIVNQVQYACDGWGNLVEEWQAHDGAVNTSTTESVQYVVDDGAASGVAKYLRVTEIVYPDGRQVVHDYGSSGSTDDVLSRIASIGDGTDVHASYAYLGLDTIVTEDYEEPEVKLDYSGSNFSALDTFGRVLDHIWSSYGTSPGTLDEYNYAFDRAGNRTSRTNALETTLSQAFDYDNLNQLISAERGSGYLQEWDLDGLGNWSSFDDDGTVQTRATNAANEITSTTGLATPTYDLAGNMIETPKPGSPSNEWDVTFDAWNRVVEVTDGTTTVAYEYDGQDRRTLRVTGSTEEHFYYDGDQVVEVRQPDGQGALEPETQYVWSLRYVDSPILRDSFSAGTLVPADRLYYLTDANHNVTAVVDIVGDVQERYDYDAYGKFTIYDPNWANPGTTSAVGNTLLFAGQDVDPATGLQYSRARWYSSITGGFLSRDPSGYSAGDMNLYRYVNSNPVIYVDPTGLYGAVARGAIGAAGGVAGGVASGWATGGVLAGPPGAFAGAVAGGIAGGIGGLIAGLMMPCNASFGEIAAAGLAVGLAAGIGEGVAAGVAATWGGAAAAGGTVAAGGAGLGGAAGGAGLGGAAAAAGGGGLGAAARGAAGAMGRAGGAGLGGAAGAGALANAAKRAGSAIGNFLRGESGALGFGAREAAEAAVDNGAKGLARRLASDEQLGQAIAGQGEAIFGAGTTRQLKDATRLAREYGGDAADWAKMRSTSSAAHGTQTPAGANFELHWYQNVKTRAVAEFKTKVLGH